MFCSCYCPCQSYEDGQVRRTNGFPKGTQMVTNMCPFPKRTQMVTGRCVLREDRLLECAMRPNDLPTPTLNFAFLSSFHLTGKFWKSDQVWYTRGQGEHTYKGSARIIIDSLSVSLSPCLSVLLSLPFSPRLECCHLVSVGLWPVGLEWIPPSQAPLHTPVKFTSRLCT